MGKGRKPCCDKAGVKRGPWSQAEDFKLISFIQKHGHNNWRALPKLAGLARCGKSCRLRWVNYLRPDLKRGNFSPQEEETIIRLHQELGNKWSKIASHFPGRTDNEIKNVWNTHLKKRLKAKGLCPAKSTKSSRSTLISTNTTASNIEAIDESNNTNSPEQVPVHQTNNRDTIEYSSSSSTTTSYNSQPSFSNHSMIEDCLNPNPIQNIDDHNNKGEARSMGEDDKNSENCYYSLDELIEMPFEPNLDLWDLLHGDNEVQVKDVDFTTFENDKKTKNENLMQGGGAGENWWWLVYLENELGLLDPQNESTLVQSTKATTSTHHDFCTDISI